MHYYQEQKFWNLKHFRTFFWQKLKNIFYGFNERALNHKFEAMKIEQFK